jgi:putative drug exporter of the RND superfamily
MEVLPMLARLADFSYRRRWFVVAFWIVALVGTTVANSAFGGEWRGNARLDGTDSQRAYDLIEERVPSKSGSSATVVFAVDGDVTAKQASIEKYLNEVKKIEGVVTVGSPFAVDGQISASRSIAFATVDFTQEANFDVAELLQAKATALKRDGVTAEFSGFQFAEGELPASEIFGLLAAAIILAIAFGSILAAGLPLITAIIGIGIGLGSVGLWAALVDTPDFTVQVASMIGIGVGIDYALFIVTRFREAKGRGADVRSAIAEASSTAGRAVVFAGLTVMVSLLGMILMRLRFVNGLAIGSSTAVAVAVLAAITLLPALLGFAGNRIKPVAVRTRTKRSFWVGWSHLLQRRAWPAAILGMVLLLAIATPTLAMRLGEADASSAPKSQTIRRAHDLLATGFTPGFASPFLLAIDTPDDEARKTLDAIASKVRATPGIAFVTPPQPTEDGKAAIITAIAMTAPQDRKTESLLHHLRKDVLPTTISGTNAKVFVGGAAASNADFATFIGQRLPYFIGAVLVISFLLMMAMFRSVLVPLKAVILNLLSIGAAYGVMVAVFQWGWAGSLFGVSEGAPIAPWAPMMLFAIVFGLSMDYEVFLLSKIRERYDATGDNSAAVAEGVAATARVITAAAAIMVFVFGFFVFGSSRDIKLIGLGLATAVLIDATIVRLVLVPATMELLGDRNWWLPRWLDRVVPHLDVEHGKGTAPGHRAAGVASVATTGSASRFNRRDG